MSHFSVPRAFISYSHDSLEHKAWVEHLARNLRANGVDVALDQWDLQPGEDAALFMEQGVTSADWVLIVCTDPYVRKANEGRGGAGYEKMIMTAELVTDQTTSKFIPLIRGTTAPTVPTFISTRIYIDFTDDTVYEQSVVLLLRTIHGVAHQVRPPLGPNPYAPGGSGNPNIV